VSHRIRLGAHFRLALLPLRPRWRGKLALVAAGQRPITEAALTEASGDPAWKLIPSWFIHGDSDKNIPPAAMRFMAQRASSRHTREVKGASHVVMTSHPQDVAGMIVEAANAATAMVAR